MITPLAHSTKNYLLNENDLYVKTGYVDIFVLLLALASVMRVMHIELACPPGKEFVPLCHSVITFNRPYRMTETFIIARRGGGVKKNSFNRGSQ